MARKDDILKTFLNHPLIEEKYNVPAKSIPQTVREALMSNEPIIKAIALIVENLECNPPATENTLRNTITQYLSKAAI